MSYFFYRQNNSGGWFDTDDKVCMCVIVEAQDAEHANAFAESIGIYFNGCDSGDDCECCGDRWYEVNDRDATDVPLIYDKHPSEFVPWFIKEGAVFCRVYHADGNVDEYVVPDDNKKRIKQQSDSIMNAVNNLMKGTLQ